MGTYRLETLLNPRSIAIAGASEKPGSIGGIVLRNLLDSEFEGSLTPINPKYDLVHDVACFPTLTASGVIHDLVVIATPAASVAKVVGEAASLGCKTAIILTAGLGHGPGSASEAALMAARTSGVRLVGPNCLGVLSPGAKMNASFAPRLPPAGPLALISQSGAIASSIAEWGTTRGIGFSGIISIGEAIDIDVADCIDYFAQDRSTRAILLYVESITNARKFMSAARRAARIKPVIVIKAGRHAEGAKAAATHTGALAGSDVVYAAAFERAGCVRVMDLGELFRASEAFSLLSGVSGSRIAVLTNGGGLGVLAVDRLVDLGGRLAELSSPTLAALDKVLPSTWSRANPIDIIGDATPGRYADALECLLADEGCDAILVMNCPTGVSSSDDTGTAVIEVIEKAQKKGLRPVPVFACWLGADEALRSKFRAAGIVPFENEAEAIGGISTMVRDYQQRERLTRPIPPLSEPIEPDRVGAARVIRDAIAEGTTWLSPLGVFALLTAYGIPATPVVQAVDAAAAAEAAKPFLAAGGACVVKLLSPDIQHKSDVDGVRLNLASMDAVRSAVADILERAHRLRPDARIDGVVVQPMMVQPKARELITGIAVDPTFGPVILFGHGGTAVELIDDKALTLLPLDIVGAEDLIARTRISRLLKGYRNVPAANTQALAQTLVRLSRLIEDTPEIIGLDLNPLLADETGVIALDARVEIDPALSGQSPSTLRDRFAVRPYPRHLEETVVLRGGSEVFIRPLRPEDETALALMMRHVTPEDIRLRFFNSPKALDRSTIARLTQLDYARDMALVAISPPDNAILGVVRAMGDSNRETMEYAILIRSDKQNAGIGTELMQRMIRFARAEGYTSLSGPVLTGNTRMLAFCRKLGLSVSENPAGGEILTSSNLQD